MKATVITISCIMSLFMYSSCTKEPLNNLTDDEARIYITNHNDSVSFNSYTTFSVADSVAIISNNQLVKKSVTALDTAYINAVKAQMLARGYTEVARDGHPDLGISISQVYNTYTGVFNYYDYWGYYSGYWDPYYWGYPGYGYYFPSYGVYQITDGAVSIDMIDLKNTAGKELKAVWNGLVRGAGTFNTSKAAGSVQALFAQSTYLTKN
ncbi:MAG: DUF4136 domain-containing protein [Chitinophagaceae bacterium]